MEKRAPPSPAPSHDEMLQSEFDQLLQNRAAACPPCTVPYQGDQSALDTGLLAVPHPCSRYGTPAPQPAYSPGYGPGLQYHQFAYDSPYGMYPGYPDPSSYGLVREEIPQPNQHPYGTPATSPPTPSQRSDVISLRSGRVPRSTALKPLSAKTGRVEKKPRAKAKSKKEKEQDAETFLSKMGGKPLSALAEDLEKLKGIKPVSIEEFVNRPAEARRREVDQGKNPGRTPRPMNAFMLYRKAYQHLSKELLALNNHQHVSSVCGVSWRKETPEVKARFNQLYELERQHHQQAHPDYKFAPSKPKKAGGGSRKMDNQHHEGDEHSDLDDFDWENGASRSVSRAPTKTPREDDDYQPPRSIYAQSFPGTPAGGGQGAQGEETAQNRSTFQYSNPGKPLPTPYDQNEVMNGHYYQPQVQQSHLQQMPGIVEDMILRKTPAPVAYQMGQYSEAAAYDITSHFQHHPHHPHQHQHPHPHQHQQPLQHEQAFTKQEPQIDPSLLTPEGNLYDLSYPSAFTDVHAAEGPPGWQGSSTGVGDGAQPFYSDHFSGGYEDGLLQDQQQPQLVQGNGEGWQIEPLDPGPFDWVDQAGSTPQ